jgi:hypothetical protein
MKNAENINGQFVFVSIQLNVHSRAFHPLFPEWNLCNALDREVHYKEMGVIGSFKGSSHFNLFTPNFLNVIFLIH